MCFIFSFWARAIVLCTSKDVYQEAGLYMSLINLKNGLLLFCVIILLISFCLFPVKYVSRAVAICLEQKTCFLSCFCSCSLYNIETVRTAQMYSSATVFSLYMKIDLSTYTYIGSSTSIYIHLHACACHVLTSELDCFLPQTPWRPSRALRGHVSQFLYMEVSSLQAEGGKKPEAANYIIFLLQSLLFFYSKLHKKWDLHQTQKLLPGPEPGLWTLYKLHFPFWQSICSQVCILCRGAAPWKFRENVMCGYETTLLCGQHTDLFSPSPPPELHRNLLPVLRSGKFHTGRLFTNIAGSIYVALQRDWLREDKCFGRALQDPVACPGLSQDRDHLLSADIGHVHWGTGTARSTGSKCWAPPWLK